MYSDLVLLVSNLLIALVLLGLAHRSRLRRASLWTAYLAVILVVQLVDPGLRVSWVAFSLSQVAYALLELAIAAQIAVKVFGRLPGARRLLSTLLLLGALLALAYIVAAPSELHNDWARYLGKVLLPRLKLGVMTAAITVAVVWLYYRVPLDHLHQGITLGLALYLCLSVIALDQYRMWGWYAHPWNGYIDTTAYVLLLGYWTYEAWRPEEAFADAATELRRFWPWIPRLSR